MTEPAEYPTLALNPQGHLIWAPRDGDMWPVEAAVGRVAAAFSAGVTAGLLHLASREADTQLPAVATFWRRFARQYLTQFCHRPETDGLELETPSPSEADLAVWVDHAPPMMGGEYLSVGALNALWVILDKGTRLEAGRCPGGPEAFLKGLSPIWRMVGRVCFHLAENPKNPEFPFAFLATYSSGVSSGGQIQHRPLGQALRENAGEGKQDALYEQSVNEMRTKLEEVDGIARRGLVLGYIMRFKQICNHPSHWLRDQTYSDDEQGGRAFPKTVRD